MSAAESRGAAEGTGGVTGVLAALWEARGREVAMRELLRQTGGTLPKVQAAVKELAARGCRIERSPAGLSLATVGVACWRELLESIARRSGWRLGRAALVFAETGSTNDAAWEAAEGARGAEADGLVVLADHQTAGRGRLGRTWTARAGQSVLLSVLLHGVAAEAMDRLTLLAGLATAVGIERAVEAAQGSMGRVEIRWPNDLMAAGRKLAGILVETRKVARRSGTGGEVEAVVVGIGINVAQGAGDFPVEIAERSISLFQACGRMVDRMRVVEAVLASLDESLKVEGRAAWLGAWKERCGMLGRRVTLRSGARVITGQVLDVAPMQGLIVRDDQGATHFLSARTCSVIAEGQNRSS